MNLPRPGDRAPCLLKLPRGDYRACGCGRSSQWPLCAEPCAQPADALPFQVAREGGRVWLCACGDSRRLPHCDGRHNRPPSGRAD